MLKQKHTKTSTPEKAKAVDFFNHFPSNFLRPYALANDDPDPDTINRRTNPKSCEWLVRPDFAMSEFCATLHENAEFLKNDDTTFLNQESLHDIFKNMEQYMAPLKRLNKKSGDGPAEEDDVRKVLTMLYDESSPLTDGMKRMFKFGGAMFTMSIQFLVAQHYLSDPNLYASRLCNDNEHCKQFQTNRDVKSLHEMLKSMCGETGKSSSQSQSPAKKNLLEQLQDIGKPTKQKARKRSYVAINSSSSSSSDSSSDDSSDDSSSDSSDDVSLQAPDTSKVKASRSKRGSPKSTASSTTVKQQEPSSSLQQKSSKSPASKKLKPATTPSPEDEELNEFVAATKTKMQQQKKKAKKEKKNKKK